MATVMLLRENGDGWQLFAMLLILALLGETLTPILERFVAAAERRASNACSASSAAREVVAVRGRDARSVRVGETGEPLAAGETVVVRPA